MTNVPSAENSSVPEREYADSDADMYFMLHVGNITKSLEQQHLRGQLIAPIVEALVR